MRKNRVLCRVCSEKQVPETTVSAQVISTKSFSSLASGLAPAFGYQERKKRKKTPFSANSASQSRAVSGQEENKAGAAARANGVF